MKPTKLLVILVAAIALLSFSTSDAWAGCCQDAKKAGKACDHACCIAAAKAKKSCEKCNPKKTKTEKKEEKK